MSQPDFVQPATWLGGQTADYALKVLKNGGWGTQHIPTGKVIPHVLANPTLQQTAGKIVGSAASGGAGMLLNGANLAVGMKTLATAKATLATAKAGLVVGSAGLGVGLLGLGVGVWSAWNIAKTRKAAEATQRGVEELQEKVDHIGADVKDLKVSNARIEHYLRWQTQHLEELVTYNTALLGVIIDGQSQLAAGIDALSRQIEEGFSAVLDSLEDLEAQREARDLETQMQTVHSYYALCSEKLSQGEMPPRKDLRAIIDKAVELRAWLETRLAELEVGSAKRLPYFVAMAFALRQEVDAREILEHAPEARERDFDKLRAQIAKEIASLSEAPLFEVATKNHVLIEHYVYLRRALGKHPSTMVEFENGHMVPFFSPQILHWDDHLASVREIAGRSDRKTAEMFNLESLKKQRAWSKLGGYTTGRAEVRRDELETVLGFDELSHEDFAVVLDFAANELDEAKQVVEQELAYV